MTELATTVLHYLQESDSKTFSVTDIMHNPNWNLSFKTAKKIIEELEDNDCIVINHNIASTFSII